MTNNSTYDPVKDYKFPHDFDTERYKSYIKFRIGRAKTSHNIILPTPPNLSFSSNLKYNDVSLGVVAGSFDIFKDEMNKSGNDLTTSLKNSATAIAGQSIGSTNAPAQIALASALARSMKISTVTQILEPFEVLAKQDLRAQGKAINPNTELYFQDVGLRTFSFTFRLAAKNKKDSDAIKNIVETFEYASHPKNIGNFLFDYPDECIITFYEGKFPNEYIPTINTCVITGFNHVYNSDTNAFFDNTGAPLTVDITVSFQEISVNTKETINRSQSDVNRTKFKTRTEPNIDISPESIQNLFGGGNPNNTVSSDNIDTANPTGNTNDKYINSEGFLRNPSSKSAPIKQWGF